jgi:hypothetical protein
MRICLFVSLLSLALLGSAAMGVEDVAPDQKKPTEMKTGVLSEKPGNAGEGVVAILTVQVEAKAVTKEEKKAERKAKKHGGDAAAAGEKINLIAQGELATKLADLAKRSATADVTGVLDGASMKVTDVLEKVPGGDAATEKRHKKNKGP